MTTKSFLPTQEALERSRKWHQIDANGAVLGRLASKAAGLLRGKHRRDFTPSLDSGDFVLVTHASKVMLTGAKSETKNYFSHSGWASGAKVTPFRLKMEKDPRQVVFLAVKRMLPVNRLRARQLRRLKIYPGDAPASILHTAGIGAKAA